MKKISLRPSFWSGLIAGLMTGIIAPVMVHSFTAKWDQEIRNQEKKEKYETLLTHIDYNLAYLKTHLLALSAEYDVVLTSDEDFEVIVRPEFYTNFLKYGFEQITLISEDEEFVAELNGCIIKLDELHKNWEIFFTANKGKDSETVIHSLEVLQVKAKKLIENIDHVQGHITQIIKS